MISEKQQKILAFPYSKYDALICDGAVRSGKTSIMMWAFVRWAMENFSGQRFGVCGRTVDSCTKNIIVPFTAMSLAKERYIIRWRRGDKVMEVRRGAVTNYFEVFGGKDEASYTLIQGRTLAGVLLDEVVLMPRSFVEQALARCSVDGAKLWFSCNPSNPNHWFYNDWILRQSEKNALYLHFEMQDNPGLSKKTLERFEKMYSGVFYERYVRGRWVVAEGLVYQKFGEDCIVHEIPTGGEYYISVDYGTHNPFSAGLWHVTSEQAVRIAEYYYCGRDEKEEKSPEEYYTEIRRLASGRDIQCVVVDPSADAFIATIKKHHEYKVRGAVNDVMPGIQTTSEMLASGKVKIYEGCKNTIREFGLYRWDEKSEVDRVVKENDHAMDECRYMVMTILRKKFKKHAYVPELAR